MDVNKKIALPLSPELAERAWSARESWRVFGIMAEFVEATDADHSGSRAVLARLARPVPREPGRGRHDCPEDTDLLHVVSEPQAMVDTILDH